MAPSPKQYDYIVIGGGSGGSGAARRASGWYGKKTAIIDAGISGGCCVNVGYVCPATFGCDMLTTSQMRSQEDVIELCLDTRSY